MVTYRPPSDSSVSPEPESEPSTYSWAPESQNEMESHNELQQKYTELLARVAQMEQAAGPVTPAARVKKESIKCEPFNGSDRALYAQFAAKQRAKVAVERPSIGGPYECVWQIFGYLEGQAAAQVLPWMTTYASDASLVTEGTIDSLFRHLDFLFKDKEAQAKALRGLTSLRQGQRPFQVVLAELQRLLMEAGGHGWEDRQKAAYLDNSLNNDLKDSLITVDKKDSFEEYCAQLQQIADRLEDRKSRRTNPPKSFAPVPPMAAPSSNTGMDPDRMDWEPSASRNRSTSARRARYVSDEEIQRRREEGRCLRCGGSNHRVAQCPFLPPIRPSRSRRVATSRVDPREVHDADLEGESGAGSEPGKV